MVSILIFTSTNLRFVQVTRCSDLLLGPLPPLGICHEALDNQKGMRRHLENQTKTRRHS
jgi:hypothetical protein